MQRAWGSNASPADVRATARQSRCSNRSPSSASRRRICWLTAGWPIRTPFPGAGQVGLLGDRNEVRPLPQFHK